MGGSADNAAAAPGAPNANDEDRPAPKTSPDEGSADDSTWSGIENGDASEAVRPRSNSAAAAASAAEIDVGRRTSTSATDPLSSSSSGERKNNKHIAHRLSSKITGAVRSGAASVAGSVAGTRASATSAERARRLSHASKVSRASKGRSSSLQLRKVPEHILLGPLDMGGMDGSGRSLGMDDLEDEGAFADEVEPEGAGKSKRGLLQRTCLRKQYSLRDQLMLSFGIVSALTVLFVMIISVIVSVSAGHVVKTSSQGNLKGWAQGKVSSGARYVSEAFAPMLPGDVSAVLRQAVRERFVGYPDDPGYEGDEWVPFRDMDGGGRAKYPIDAPPLPLDWQIGEGNVNIFNHREHVGERRGWYGPPRSTPLSTAGAFFTMQGACDPSVADPADKTYHPNCTDASNDVSTGGSVAPSPSAASIYAKGKDLSPFLKALYESAPMIKTIAVLFSNGGAGAGVLYPHAAMDGTAGYESIGCDWMRSDNPLKPGEGVPVGTEREIARCHREGERVSSREYNALERGWCREQALDPDRTHYVGPYLDAWSDHLWLMTAGRAVYDKRTKEFIGCMVLDISVEQMTKLLESVKITEGSLITLVRWDEGGTVMSSPNWDSDAANDTTTVDDPELGVGISREDFAVFRNLVDFSAPWDPEEVQEEFTGKILRRGSKIVSSYPVPPPPQSYDESYKPEFMVIVTLERSDLFQSIYDLGRAIDGEVRKLIIFTVSIGFAGLGGIFGIIFAVSAFLTRPLRWMKEASDKIIGDFGNEGVLPESTEDGGVEENFLEGAPGGPQTQSEMGVDATSKVEGSNGEVKSRDGSGGAFGYWARCAPETELSDLTREFEKLVSQFVSDGTAAKAVRLRSRLTDERNHFSLEDEFDGLYESRKGPGFEYRYRDGDDGANGAGGRDDGDGLPSAARSVCFGKPKLVNFGPNILAAEDESRSVTTAALLASNDGPLVKSRLFRWIVGLAVTPLLAVTVTISAVVTERVTHHFTEIDEIVKKEYIDLEKQAAATAADLRAIHASEVMQKASRDLHLLSRFAGWLLFDGLNRTESFTNMHSSAEECKTAGGWNECDHIFDAPCDCAWGVSLASVNTCTNYPETNDTRYLQELFFEGQRGGARPNGDRNFTPAQYEATSPNRTAWWDDPLMVSGHDKGSSAKGYETTYDRLRVISATSAIQIPLYNYASSGDKALATYIGFEADGMMVGYGGCGHDHADYAFFVSSEQNGAANLRPDLCPLGKYGYDARCRDWYHTGKGTAKKHGAPLFVTPPYLFASSTVVAQSATLPLVDPRNGELVGMALFDFVSTAIFSSLQSTQLVPEGFPILITTRADVLKNDTVIGPNFNLGSDAARVEEVVVPHDWSCLPNCSSGTTGFDEIAAAMRAGKNGTASFVRTTEKGGKEKMHISYAPVSVTSYRPLNHSDFSRGVESFSSLVYSLAFVQPESSLLAQFEVNSEEIKKNVNIAIGVLSAVIVLASAFLVYISARVTVSITVPILHLLKMIRNVNRLDNKDDFTPPTDGSGSSEVSAVYGTFEVLFKVIRFANSAFFSGDIEKAYSVLTDALKVFRSLDNKKAVGVASNNLGNCMLAMYRTMETTKETQICGMSKAEIISKGTAYFREAIKLGEEAYDVFYEEQGWSGSCLVFMQHLSSRYFNRAIFLLTVKKDHKHPEEANRLGFRDLDIAKNMDVEVADQCLEVGFRVNKSELFDLMLNRIRGVLSLMEMGYDDEWGIEDQINDAFRELKRGLKNPSLDFFIEVSPAGRMQELDTELIKHAQLTNATEEAAKVGVRMLVEDEYIFHYAESAAVKALLDYVTAEGKEKGFSSETEEALLALKDDLEFEFMESVMNRISDVQRSEELSSLRSSGMKMHTSTNSADSRRSISVVRQTSRGDFTMESF